jgi:hypothetical protein
MFSDTQVTNQYCPKNLASFPIKNALKISFVDGFI